jgi:hypothetical protein
MSRSSRIARSPTGICGCVANEATLRDGGNPSPIHATGFADGADWHAYLAGTGKTTVRCEEVDPIQDSGHREMCRPNHTSTTSDDIRSR